MIHNCSATELFNAPCQYNGEVDTDKQAYSVRHINGKTYYYHYLDYARSVQEQIITTPSIKKKLCRLLLSLWEAGKKDLWIASFLASCGYRVDDGNS